MRQRKYSVKCPLRHQLLVLKNLVKGIEDGALKDQAQKKIKELEDRIAAAKAEKTKES